MAKTNNGMDPNVSVKKDYIKSKENVFLVIFTQPTMDKNAFVIMVSFGIKINAISAIPVVENVLGQVLTNAYLAQM